MQNHILVYALSALVGLVGAAVVGCSEAQNEVADVSSIDIESIEDYESQMEKPAGGI